MCVVRGGGWEGVMSPVLAHGGLLACASVAIGLSEDQGLTVTYPLLWQQHANTSVSQSVTHTLRERD